MLLNEIQKQHRIIEELKAANTQQVSQQDQEIQSLKEANFRLEAEMEKLRALLVSK